MNTQINSDYVPDVLIVGGGIAGLQSALDLADQGLQVLVVERNASIGGRMISLSKVFPTLDCASCITTPKMSAAAHHPNIQILTNTEVQAIDSRNGIHSVPVMPGQGAGSEPWPGYDRVIRGAGARPVPG